MQHSPFPNPEVDDEVLIEARIVDSDAVSAHVEWSIDGDPQPDVPMGSDDGINFGASLGTLNEGVFVGYLIRAEDTTGNVMRSFSRGFEVIPPLPKEHDVLLVVDDQRHWEVEHIAAYYKMALDGAGIGYDFWDASFRGPPFEEDLMPYKDGAVVLSVPHDDAWLFHHPDPGRVTGGIAAFLSAGGSLFASGQQIAEQYRHRNPAWLAKYLHVKHSWCCPSNGVEPVSGEIFGDDKGCRRSAIMGHI